MKKALFLLLAFGLFAFSTQTATAQQSLNSGFMKVSASSPEIDTVTNAETLHLYKAVAGYQDILTIQALFTRLSGTAAGTAVLSGSVFPSGTSGTIVWEPIDTFTLSNSASQSTIFKVGNDEQKRYAQYRLTMSGGTTVVYTVRAYLLPRITVVLPKN